MHFTWMQTFCSCSLGKSLQSGIFTKEGLIAIVGIIINRHTWPACFWKEWSKFTEVTLTKISHSHVIMLPNWRASNNKKKLINHLFWFVALLVSKLTRWVLNSLCNFASLFYACYECENRFLPSQMDKWMDGGNSIKPVWERPFPGDTFAVSWRQEIQ